MMDLATQVQIGVEERLKHDSSIHCDEPVSFPKAALTRFVGRIDDVTMEKLNRALAKALGLESQFLNLQTVS